MKRVLKIASLLVVAGLLLVSCGGGGSNNNNNPPSGITTRAFVSNSFASSLNVVDYSRQLWISSVSGLSQPTLMAVSPDHSTTIVFDQGLSNVAVVTNQTEAPSSGPTMPAAVSSIVFSSDSKTAYLATRNATVSGAQNGAIQVLGIANLTLGTQIPVPLVTNLVMSSDGKKLLAFSDQGDSLYFVDPTATTPAAIPITGTGMSRPVTAAFSADSTKAYIASCGSECGGSSSAGVSVLDLSTTPTNQTTAGAKQNVNAASVILTDSSNNIYVAGTQSGSTTGSLTVLTASGTTLTISKPAIDIGGGFHTQILSAPNNKIFIGAKNCPDGTNTGCLTMYNTSAGTAKMTTGPLGSVTGMAVVPRSNLVYVVTGGELLTYDTTTDAIFTGPCNNTIGRCFIDVIGQAVDVKIIDP